MLPRHNCCELARRLGWRIGSGVPASMLTDMIRHPHPMQTFGESDSPIASIRGMGRIKFVYNLPGER